MIDLRPRIFTHAPAVPTRNGQRALLQEIAARGTLFVGVLSVDGFIETDLLAHLADFHRRKPIDDAQHPVGEHEGPPTRKSPP